MNGLGNNSSEQLKSIISRIENLDEQIGDLQDDKNDVFAEAKGQGFDVPALKAILKERKADKDKLANLEAIKDTYRVALGMLSGTVFEDAARANVSKGA